MKKKLIITCLTILILIVVTSYVKAGYLDECLTKILPMEDRSFIAAVQCKYLDFFIYLDKDGEVIKRNYVPSHWRDTLKLIDFIPEDRMYLIYESEGDDSNHRGMICDFEWNMIHETGLEGMQLITMVNGAWWGLVEGPAIREVSFDGYESVDHPLPVIKGADYFRDLRKFTVDMNGNFILLFCIVDELGNCKDGMIRKIYNGELIAQWIIDVPYVPEMDIIVDWVGPVVDHDGNIIVAHYENPCDAKNDDRVRIHKFNKNGAELWIWGQEIFILSDLRFASDDTIIILSPGGPIYRLSPKGQYLGEVIIEGITTLEEPDCGQNK